jgi:hypothetical protein
MLKKYLVLAFVVAALVVMFIGACKTKQSVQNSELAPVDSIAVGLDSLYVDSIPTIVVDGTAVE